jgi:hypothetical protein
MSLNKPPSFVGVDEKEGTFTVAFLDTWYKPSRCAECPRFQVRGFPGACRTIAYCECVEAEEPCEITGERYMNEVKEDPET